MRGFVVSEHAHPSKISASSNVPEPKAGEGQVLVDVYSAGLNFFDVSAYISIQINKLLTQASDSSNTGKISG